MAGLAFPKPKDKKKIFKPAVKVFSGGREVCDQLTKAGRDEYVKRKLDRYEEQGCRCALQITDICKQRQGRWPKDEITLDHEDGRGMGGGKRDDRMWVIKDGKLVKQNAAVCWHCNSQKGSRKIPYLYCP